jgi:hypothetical protein
VTNEEEIEQRLQKLTAMVKDLTENMPDTTVASFIKERLLHSVNLAATSFAESMKCLEEDDTGEDQEDDGDGRPCDL